MLCTIVLIEHQVSSSLFQYEVTTVYHISQHRLQHAARFPVSIKQQLAVETLQLWAPLSYQVYTANIFPPPPHPPPLLLLLLQHFTFPHMTPLPIPPLPCYASHSLRDPRWVCLLRYQSWRYTPMCSSSPPPLGLSSTGMLHSSAILCCTLFCFVLFCFVLFCFVLRCFVLRVEYRVLCIPHKFLP